MNTGVLIQVFICIFLALCAGLLTGPETMIGGVSVVRLYHLCGQLFLHALMCVVTPLVVTSLMSSVAQLGADGTLGKLGKKAFSYFVLTSLIAVLIGFIAVMAIKPGIRQEFAPTEAIHAGVDSFAKVEEFILKVIPSNIVMAAAQGQMLSLILFSVLFGYFISQIDSDNATVILRLVKGVYQIMIKVTRFILRALPLGVFGLVAEAVASTGLSAMTSALWFLLTMLIAMAVYCLIVLPAMLRLIAGVNAVSHLKLLMPALLTAFSTSSSAAALPLAIECMEKKGRNTRRICHLTLPLGSSLNMPGTALFICVAVCFLSQLYGVQMGLGLQVAVILLSLITSFGVAGIPSAGIISLSLVLQMVGLPVQGIGFILTVEWILAMLRSAVNLYGNTCSTAFVTGEEKGEEDAVEAYV